MAGSIQLQGYSAPHYTNVMYPWDGHEAIEPGGFLETMHKYTDLARREKRYQGGFIWDYIDQAIRYILTLYLPDADVIIAAEPAELKISRT